MSYGRAIPTTANYSGEVYRTGVTVIRYTVIFHRHADGAWLRRAAQSGGLNWLMVALPALAALRLGAPEEHTFHETEGAKDV